MFKMKTTKRYSKRLAHQNNPHAEIIETNRRKTSNQTDPHKIFKILNTQMHPISSMTGFFDLKFCNLIHNSEYISLCILDFCTAERKLLYSQSYCIVFAYLVVCKHIRMHSRIHPAYTNTNTTQTHSFPHSAYAKHGETHTRTQPRPRNMPGAASQRHMARVEEIWGCGGGFGTEQVDSGYICHVFFHKLCIILRAETSCKHSGTLSHPQKQHRTRDGNQMGCLRPETKRQDARCRKWRVS